MFGEKEGCRSCGLSLCDAALCFCLPFRNMGADGMRGNPFPSNYAAGTFQRDTLNKNGTLGRSSTLGRGGGTMSRSTLGGGAVVDDYTPSYEAKPEAKQAKGAKKPSRGHKAPSAKNTGYSSKTEKNPTYIDDVDDEFDYLY